MTNKGLFLMTLLVGFIGLCNGVSYASKTTDLMSEALKQRSNGNINAAIKGFKKAVDEAPSLLQRNLALFMLGDCQLEVSHYEDAVTTFSELSKKATTADERAEALFKLMEANSNLGKTEEVNKSYSELKKKYPKSAYYEIGAAFMKASNIMESDYTGPIIIDEPTETQIKSKKEAPKKQEKADIKIAKSTKSDNKPVKQETKKTEKEPSKVVASKPANKAPTGKKLDNKTTAILEKIINIEPVSDSEKDDLVSKILSYQDKLKDGEKGAGKDKVLFELAGATAKFGELLEACKTYDKILSLHPTSQYVEQAYYEAIRLRAILGVHQAVIEWARAFNITFPNSKYKQNIAALVSYSQAGGKVQLSSKSSSGTNSKAAKNNIKSKSSGNSSNSEADAALKASSLYKNATKKMNDGKYSSALDDLKVLASKFSDSPQLWWDTTLVYVQLEEFKKADKSIRKMLSLDPDNSDANSLLGYIQYRLENYDEAASAYEQAGEAEGEGVTFFDAKTASERMKKNASR